MTPEDQALVDAAREAARHSHSPYSGYRVGSALRCRDGGEASGTNVENRSYGLTICAERVAMTHAAAQGWRELEAVAVWVDADELALPCGACLQVLSEFAPEGDEVRVLLACPSGSQETTLAALMPRPFLGA